MPENLLVGVELTETQLIYLNLDIHQMQFIF